MGSVRGSSGRPHGHSPEPTNPHATGPTSFLVVHKDEAGCDLQHGGAHAPYLRALGGRVCSCMRVSLSQPDGHQASRKESAHRKSPRQTQGRE